MIDSRLVEDADGTCHRGQEGRADLSKTTTRDNLTTVLNAVFHLMCTVHQSKRSLKVTRPISRYELFVGAPARWCARARRALMLFPAIEFAIDKPPTAHWVQEKSHELPGMLCSRSLVLALEASL